MMPPRRPTKWYRSPRSSTMSPVSTNPSRIGQRRCVWADIGTRGSRRTNPQRSVLDLHFDATAVIPDHGCGKTFQAVIYGKANAGLGRRIGMTDRGFGKGPAQAVKHGLIGDLARQPNVTRRKPRDRSAHQKFAPVRWRAGNLGNTRRAQPRDVIGQRLSRLRQDHRTAADNGAQEDLKATVAANVIESGPDRGAAPRRAIRDNRAGQSLQGMADDLRHARGARCQHQPFRRPLGLRLGGRTPGRAGGHDQLVPASAHRAG